MRVSAGPNGSGKSELKFYLPESLLGRYLNPDEIESGIRQSGLLNLPAWGVMTTPEEVLPFFAQSDFLREVGLAESAANVTCSGWMFGFRNGAGECLFRLRSGRVHSTKTNQTGRDIHFGNRDVPLRQSGFACGCAKEGIPHLFILRGNG